MAEDTTAGSPVEETADTGDETATPDANTGTISARKAQAKAARLDETIKGGRYQREDGTFYNAHGQTIDEEGNVLDGTQTPPPPIAE